MKQTAIEELFDLLMPNSAGWNAEYCARKNKISIFEEDHELIMRAAPQSTALIAKLKLLGVRFRNRWGGEYNVY